MTALSLLTNDYKQSQAGYVMQWDRVTWAINGYCAQARITDCFILVGEKSPEVDRRPPQNDIIRHALPVNIIDQHDQPNAPSETVRRATTGGIFHRYLYECPIAYPLRRTLP